MTLPIIRHLGFPVANLLFNLQLATSLFCAKFVEEIQNGLKIWTDAQLHGPNLSP